MRTTLLFATPSLLANEISIKGGQSNEALKGPSIIFQLLVACLLVSFSMLYEKGQPISNYVALVLTRAC